MKVNWTENLLGLNHTAAIILLTSLRYSTSLNGRKVWIINLRNGN